MALKLVFMILLLQGIPVLLIVSPELDRGEYQRPTTNRYQRHEQLVYDQLGMDKTPYTCSAIDNNLRNTDVEHIVALAEAHDSGLSPDQMLEFSGDILNLTVAMPRENRIVKSDKDAADYLPSRNQCWFASRVVRVKVRWGLSVDWKEYVSLAAVLANCPILQLDKPIC